MSHFSLLQVSVCEWPNFSWPKGSFVDGWYLRRKKEAQKKKNHHPKLPKLTLNPQPFRAPLAAASHSPQTVFVF